VSVRAGILVTGTEVITARISDRNGPWVSQRLAALGVEVAHILVVADRPADLEAGLRFMAAQRCDLIVTSGGLGPTADDLTAEIVARFAGVELELDEGMEEKIAAIIAGFARRMRFDPEALRAANRKQAMVPRGAEALDPAGTAPGLVLAVADGPIVIVLPGPPRELHAMWPAAIATDAVRSVLARAEPYLVDTVRMFGLAALEITTCLRRGELEIDIRHRPGAEPVSAAVVAGLERRHERFIFSTDGTTIDEQVAALLRDRRRIALAESCTAGLLAARLANPPGASSYLLGGVIAYSNEAKVELLGVAEELIERHGAVSPEVAEAMAAGAARRFGADLGVGITGIAGPDGGSEDKPVGYVCICVLVPGGPRIARDPVIPGDRGEIRDRSCTLALHLIRRLLRGEDFPL
jgi:nicotinamide-nucleotide amidase